MLRRRPHRPPLAIRALAVVGCAAVAWPFLHGVPGLGLPVGWFAQYRIDLDVYRLGADAWLTGQPLYGPAFPVTGYGEALPFVYPPIAAVMFVPFSWLPMPAAATLLTVVSAAVLLAVLASVVRALGRRAGGWTVAAALPLVLLTDPVRLVLLLGQVNLLLMGLVWAGLLGRGRWRGFGVGVAAAIKLTPLVFVVWFLLVGDRRAAARAAGTFVALTGLGALLAPADSPDYWGGRLVGLGAGAALDLAYAGNQSLRGAVERWGLPAAATTGCWLVLAGTVGILALLLARRCVALGESLLAASVLSIAGLLVSPISWSNHWVWVLPALPVLVDTARRRGSGALRGALAAGAPSLVVGTHWLLPHGDGRERDWSPAEQLIGASLTWWGVVVLVVVLLVIAQGPVAPRPHPSAAPTRFPSGPSRASDDSVGPPRRRATH
ncbi:glycosyltransferase 87 family protein [Pseudonocardia sp. NPDC049635]|uniref:glycosyltransferase 87 family protein n=1 Tax=Pseudonocardia sp. NPDC049635 TaxID=3155506 RepID=UPI0033FFCCF9